jgi:hypothetical protein
MAAATLRGQVRRAVRRAEAAGPAGPAAAAGAGGTAAGGAPLAAGAAGGAPLADGAGPAPCGGALDAVLFGGLAGAGRRRRRRPGLRLRVRMGIGPSSPAAGARVLASRARRQRSPLLGGGSTPGLLGWSFGAAFRRKGVRSRASWLERHRRPSPVQHRGRERSHHQQEHRGHEQKGDHELDLRPGPGGLLARVAGQREAGVACL